MFNAVKGELYTIVNTKDVEEQEIQTITILFLGDEGTGKSTFLS